MDNINDKSTDAVITKLIQVYKINCNIYHNKTIISKSKARIRCHYVTLYKSDKWKEIQRNSKKTIDIKNYEHEIFKSKNDQWNDKYNGSKSSILNFYEYKSSNESIYFENFFYICWESRLS
jgi:hypothetical protein